MCGRMGSRWKGDWIMGLWVDERYWIGGWVGGWMIVSGWVGG